MHLMNILNQLEASEAHKEQLIAHFEKEPVSFSAVQAMYEKIKQPANSQFFTQGERSENG